MRQLIRKYGPGTAFVVPSLLLFLVFVLYPILYNMQASVLDWDGINPAQFVGLANYQELLGDPIFLTAIKNSALWFPLTFIPQAGIGLWFAVILNRRIPASTFFRSMFFIPVVLSPIVVGIVWQRILDPFNWRHRLDRPRDGNRVPDGRLPGPTRHSDLRDHARQQLDVDGVRDAVLPERPAAD